MGLPEDVAIGAGDENVGIVSSGEVDEFLPIFFVIINGNEARMQIRGNILAHAAENHGADQRRRSRKNR